MAQRGDYIALFDQLFPHFFENDYIRSIPEDHVCEEMILELSAFDPDAHPIPVPDGIRFGFFDGKIDDLKAAVAEVDEGWVKYYNSPERAYCAFDGDRVVSFCDVGAFGEAEFCGRHVRVGGPGCVGTIPSYRRRGIGLKMVSGATAILKEQGFDCSWIHYTGVGPWYAKLGYETVLRWNGGGFIG